MRWFEYFFKTISVLPLILFGSNNDGFAESLSPDNNGAEIVVETDVNLYTFGPNLTDAAAKCMPYEEDFALNNPQIKQAVVEMLGDTSFRMPIKILGKEGDLCRFTLAYTMMGQTMLYDCKVNDEQRQNLLAAMADRSRNPVTAGLEIPQKNAAPKKVVMTAGRLMIELTKLQYTACQKKTEVLPTEEQEKLEKQAQMLPQYFKDAMIDCEPSIADLKLLDRKEHVEMIGSKDGLCHFSYRNFDLYVAKDKLAEIKTYDDLAAQIYSAENFTYNYQAAYNYNGLLFELASCYRKTKIIEPNRERINYDDKMEIVSGVRRFDGEGCAIELINMLNLNGKTFDYGVVCKIPEDDLEQIVAPYLATADEYGEKSFKNVDGNMEWHNSTINDVTKRIDAKLMYILQKNNYCNMKQQSTTENTVKGEN